MNWSHSERAGARRKGGGGPLGCAQSFTGGAWACDRGTPPCCATSSAAAAAAWLGACGVEGEGEGAEEATECDEDAAERCVLLGDGAGARGRSERPPGPSASSRWTGQSLRAMIQHLPREA